MSKEFKYLTLDRSDDAVAIITLNRPEKMNSLCMLLRDEIEECFNALAADDAVRSVVLTGGPDTFSPGFDIGEVVETGMHAFSHRILEYHVRIYDFPKPIVAAVSGFALAGGFDLALCGDIIVASETAVFGHPEVRFGVNPLISPLAKKVSPSKAAEIAMTGETLDAEEALRIGLVSKVASVEGFLDMAYEIARKLAKIDPRALSSVKRSARIVPGLDIEAALEYEFGFTAALFGDEEIKAKIEGYAKRLGLV
jgi:enoyl-CoA hydratase/carnithine racemase